MADITKTALVLTFPARLFTCTTTLPPHRGQEASHGIFVPFIKFILQRNTLKWLRCQSAHIHTTVATSMLLLSLFHFSSSLRLAGASSHFYRHLLCWHALDITWRPVRVVGCGPDYFSNTFIYFLKRQYSQHLVAGDIIQRHFCWYFTPNVSCFCSGMVFRQLSGSLAVKARGLGCSSLWWTCTVTRERGRRIMQSRVTATQCASSARLTSSSGLKICIESWKSL